MVCGERTGATDGREDDVVVVVSGAAQGLPCSLVTRSRVTRFRLLASRSRAGLGRQLKLASFLRPALLPAIGLAVPVLQSRPARALFLVFLVSCPPGHVHRPVSTAMAGGIVSQPLNPQTGFNWYVVLHCFGGRNSFLSRVILVELILCGILWVLRRIARAAVSDTSQSRLLSLLLQPTVRNSGLVPDPRLHLAQLPCIHRHPSSSDIVAGRARLLQRHSIPRTQPDGIHPRRVHHLAILGSQSQRTSNQR